MQDQFYFQENADEFVKNYEKRLKLYEQFLVFIKPLFIIQSCVLVSNENL